MKRRIAISAIVLTCLWGTTATAQFGNILKKAKEAADAESKAKAKQGKSSTTSTSTTTTTTTTTTSSPDVNGQPNLTAAKIDFVPGERTVFYDDFSDMAPDEPPPHWKVRGGIVTLMTGGGVHELSMKQPGGGGMTLTSPSIAFPKNFTFEVVSTGAGQMGWKFYDKKGANVLQMRVVPAASGTSATVSAWSHENLGSGEIKTNPAEPLTAALWVQDGRLRAYLNGERLVDANEVKAADIDHVVADPGNYRTNGLRSIRIAESTPDFSKVLASTGKFVTRGILFDTDSDRLQPESAGVIRMVAGALMKNLALKLEIDGYTDSVGNANHNLDLSKRRAEAVKSVLVSQFSIDGERLTTNGFGANKPVGSNDTAEGRAANRRVEFVRQ